jgi:hypothetical protein
VIGHPENFIDHSSSKTGKKPVIFHSTLHLVIAPKKPAKTQESHILQGFQPVGLLQI